MRRGAWFVRRRPELRKRGCCSRGRWFVVVTPCALAVRRHGDVRGLVKSKACTRNALVHTNHGPKPGLAYTNKIREQGSPTPFACLESSTRLNKTLALFACLKPARTLMFFVLPRPSPTKSQLADCCSRIAEAITHQISAGNFSEAISADCCSRIAEAITHQFRWLRNLFTWRCLIDMVLQNLRNLLLPPVPSSPLPGVPEPGRAQPVRPPSLPGPACALPVPQGFPPVGAS